MCMTGIAICWEAGTTTAVNESFPERNGMALDWDKRRPRATCGRVDLGGRKGDDEALWIMDDL